MSVEYLPVGIACNIKCGYCYQDPMRDAGNINMPRDWSHAKRQLDRLGQNFAVFGGEPLLAPIEHLKEVWEFGLERFGSNGIQTNGSLITDEHIEMFAKYKVGVGISFDGPDEMNAVRCSLELTARTEVAIRKLCAVKVIPSIICTIHKGNNDLEQLTNWFNELEALGVKHLNLHEMEIDCGQHHLALSETRQIETFLHLYEWSKFSAMQVEPFMDIKKLLTQENPQVMCTWNHCDPLTTAAVQGVSPDGTMSNCGRTNKDGINWVKANTPGRERYISLYGTPQKFGGCKDCQYFVFCKGHCPGTAIDGDWRNRTINCSLWYSLFSRIEKDNQENLLTSCQKKALTQKIFVEQGQSNQHGDRPHGDEHGDHTDYPKGIPAVILERSPFDE